MPVMHGLPAAPEFDAAAVPVLDHNQAAAIGMRDRGLRAGVAAGSLFDRGAGGEAKAPRRCGGCGQRKGKQEEKRHLA